MTRRLALALTALLGASAGLFSCTPPAEPPLFASSVADAGYAERFPAALAAERASFESRETQVKTEIARFPEYPKALKDAPAAEVLKVIELADEAGRGEAYAARREEVEAIERYYAEEKDALNRKVGGAAAYAAKQQKCDYDAYSPPVGALKQGVEKSVEARLRAHNAAHRFLDTVEADLGRANADALRDQADKIALTSHNAYVGTERSARRLRELVAEASDVKSTLEREAEEARSLELNPNTSKERRQVAAKQAEALKAALGAIDLDKERAEKLLEGLEERQKQLRSSYDQALEALKEAVPTGASTP